MTTTPNHTNGLNEDIKKTFSEVEFCMKEAGAFTDKATGRLVNYPRAITLQTVGMDRKMRISARALVGLVHFLTETPDVKATLNKRMAEEMPNEKAL
jgi:hypothetical protein